MMAGFKTTLLALLSSGTLAVSTCGDTLGNTYYLDGVVVRPVVEDVVQLLRWQGEFQEQEVCGFEVHLTYDDAVLSFPDCEGPDATHACGVSPSPGVYSGLFCFCNVSARGHLEIGAIVSDGVTPLPAGPVVVGIFRVEEDRDAVPGAYPVVFERPEEEVEVSEVLCEGAQLESGGMVFGDAKVVLLEKGEKWVPAR